MKSFEMSIYSVPQAMSRTLNKWKKVVGSEFNIFTVTSGSIMLWR